MAKKPTPAPSSIVGKLWAAVRRNPIKSVTAALGILAAYPSGMAGARLIGAQAEPSWYASRAWVRDHVDDKLKPVVMAQGGDRSILRDLQIDTANRSKRDEANNLAKWNLEKEKAKDPLTLDLIDKQLDASKQSIQALDEQIKTLRELKAQGK